MPATPIRVNDTTFPTKTAATNAIRSILNRYSIGQTLNDTDARFMRGVLALHPQAAIKVGCGVASFSIAWYETTRGFRLTRTDGSQTDFSYKACLSPPTPEQEARAAFRREVRQQILDVRRATFAAGPVTCPVTGEQLTETTSHVDHEPTLEQLIQDFVTLYSLTLALLKTNTTQDNDVETLFLDRRLATSWQAYHRQHAGLRVVSRRANLSLLRRRRA